MSGVGHRPLVGRASELDTLRQAWDASLTERAGLVLVCGEAGIGKSTLVNEFVNGLGPDTEVLLGQCLTFGNEAVPYAALSQILRTLVGRVGEDTVRAWSGAGFAVLGSLVPGLSRGVPPESRDRIQVFEAVADLLQAAARERPLVLIIEDLHWADMFTGHLLRFLDAALADTPGLLIIVTYRTDEISGRHPLRPALAELQRRARIRLPLDPFNTDEIEQLVRPLLPQDASPATIRRIVERSEGIPYFAEELARSTGGHGALPATLRDALLVRFLVLDQETQQLLQVAAVMGVQFSFDDLVAVSERDETHAGEALREAMQAGLVIDLDEEQYAFKHTILRDVIHDEVLPGEHRRIHSRYADLMLARRRTSNLLELIHHLRAAGRNQEGFETALRRADELGDAHPDSVELYQVALDLWDQVDDPERILGRYDEVLNRAAKANNWLGDHLRASRLIDASIAAMPAETPPSERAERLVQRAHALKFAGLPGAEVALNEALELISDEPASPVLARVLDLQANVAMLRGDFQEALELCERAIPIADRFSPPGDPLPDRLRNTQGCCWAATGDEERGIAQLSQLLSGRAYREQLRHHTNLSHYLNLAGEYRRAADIALAGAADARALGLERYVGSMLASNAAEPLIQLGEWEHAETLISRGLALEPPTGYQLQFLMTAADLALHRGDLARSDRLLAEVAAVSVPLHEELQFHWQLTWVRGRLLLVQGKPSAAWQMIEVALRDLHPIHPALVWYVAALGQAVLADLGDQSQERHQLIEDAVEQLPESRLVPLLRAWRQAESSGRSADWLTMLDVTPSLRPMGLTLWAHLRCADAALRAGNYDLARQQVMAGTDLAGRLGAADLVGRFADLAERARQADIERPGGLTSRELQVLGLVAKGLSNAEISNELFVSTKTVSVHVSNILAKLNVSSRTEAAAWAHQRGIT